VLNYVNSLPNPAADYAAKSVRRLLALAPAGKTVLTLADFEAGAEALFHAVDADGDGTVQQNHRRRIDMAEFVVERGDLRPIGLAGFSASACTAAIAACS